MEMSIYGLCALLGLLFVGCVLELIRRRKVEERYAVLWLLLGMTMTWMSFFPSMLDKASGFFGIHYAPSLLFFMGLLFALALIMHLTMVISKQHRLLVRLAQEVALLRNQPPQAAQSRGVSGEEERK